MVKLFCHLNCKRCRLIALTRHPFSRLRLMTGEEVVWCGSNPTFHRAFEYGIAITGANLYLCGRAWLFARWRRYALSEIGEVSTGKYMGRPALVFNAKQRKIVFTTPFDFYADEMEFDLRVLRSAEAVLTGRVPELAGIPAIRC